MAFNITILLIYILQGLQGNLIQNQQLNCLSHFNESSTQVMSLIEYINQFKILGSDPRLRSLKPEDNDSNRKALLQFIDDVKKITRPKEKP